jgi:hypothetical protein
MLRIREEQMEALGARTKARFVGLMVRYLREHFARWVSALPDDGLEAWVGRALEIAEEHGVTTEPEAAQLILLFMVLGPDVEERHPWVPEVLRARSLAAIGKVKKLITLARERGVVGVEQVVVYGEMEA